MAGALGVVITTDVPMSGQHAQPVYVDDSLPIVGPSQAIVVTSGEVPQMGGPALAVRLAPAGTPALGPALPVYVVSGSLGGAVVLPPVNTVLPAISGTLAIGQVLSTTDGTWTGTAPIVYTYQWKRNGADIGGATANTYTLTTSDPGTTITSTVTATNAGGSASATSAGVTPSALLLIYDSYWKLEAASGNRVDSIFTNDLAPVNTPGNAPGIVDNGVSLVRTSSQYLTIASNPALAVGDIDFSIDGFVKLTTDVSMDLVQKYVAAGAQRQYALTYNATSKRFQFTVDSTGASALTIVTANNFGLPSLGVWHYVAAGHDAANNLIWIAVNAGTKNTAATSAGVFNGTAAFSIGRVGAEGYANAVIDEVGFGKHVFSAANLTSRYAGGSGTTWPF